MDQVLVIGKFVMANYAQIISAAVGLCSALIVIGAMIPGAEPEATLQKIVDFLARFSRKA